MYADLDVLFRGFGLDLNTNMLILFRGTELDMGLKIKVDSQLVS